MTMTPSQTAAAMHGLAVNPTIPLEDRLKCALQALEFYSERPVITVTMSEDVPECWKELVAGLVLLSRGHSNNYAPLHCEHDELTICADPAKFTDEELLALDDLGFHTSQTGDPTFYSFKFGSA